MREAARPRHPAPVRVTHWITAIAFLALLVTGLEILVSHPRFYWGEAGNVNTPPLFSIPIPSSRSIVPTGYGYVLPDQNGWSRYLHFEAAWVAVLTGVIYVAFGFAGGHFRRNLLPPLPDLAPRRLAGHVATHLRFARSGPHDDSSYNPIQRLSYLLVVFAFFPLIVWTGLCLSPAFESVFPGAVSILGGRQSARTIHFFVTIALVLFVVVHVVMVWLAGFRRRVGAMITGRVSRSLEQV
jgi:thiosulfate reductase cytochrome b subunit